LEAEAAKVDLRLSVHYVRGDGNGRGPLDREQAPAPLIERVRLKIDPAFDRLRVPVAVPVQCRGFFEILQTGVAAESLDEETDLRGDYKLKSQAPLEAKVVELRGAPAGAEGRLHPIAVGVIETLLCVELERGVGRGAGVEGEIQPAAEWEREEQAEPDGHGAQRRGA